MKVLWIGLLVGALLASVTVNVMQWRQAESADIATSQLVESLELTEAQIRELTSCCDTCGCLDEDASTALAAAERELADALTRSDVDAERVAALTADVATRRQAMLESCVDTILKVRGVLSPSQRETLNTRCCGMSR